MGQIVSNFGKCITNCGKFLTSCLLKSKEIAYTSQSIRKRVKSVPSKPQVVKVHRLPKMLPNTNAEELSDSQMVSTDRLVMSTSSSEVFGWEAKKEPDSQTSETCVHQNAKMMSRLQQGESISHYFGKTHNKNVLNF